MKKLKKMIRAYSRVRVQDSVSWEMEDGYLLIKYRKECSDLLDKNEITEHEAMDFYIAISLLLEITVARYIRLVHEWGFREDYLQNPSAFEHLAQKRLGEQIEIFSKKFSFTCSDQSIEKKVKNIQSNISSFMRTRNKLLHGHKISTRSDGGKSKARKHLDSQSIREKHKDYKKIMSQIKKLSLLIDFSLLKWKEEGLQQLLDAYIEYPLNAIKVKG